MASNFNQTVNFSIQSSSSPPRRRYDVFLSFRGEDTRETYANYLYDAFIRKEIHTFMDDDEIEAGKYVNTELMEAITESKYSVLVISVNYATSSWCLNELVKILECRKTLGQIIYPIFYRVDPSDVRKQTGKFGKGFSQAVSKNQKSFKRWKEALEEIAGLKGWVYPSSGYRTEVDFNEALTGDVFTKLKDSYPRHLESLVGMKSRMEKVINLLDLLSDETRIVGLWGMGGLGKTTIARAVYDFISWQFEGCSFIENVRAVASRSGLPAIQEQIVSDTLKVTNIKLASVTSGIEILRQRVCYKKVLIVLDDVDESIDLESLIGDHHWFSPGSRIIITTRDRHSLAKLCEVNIYAVQGLNIDEAEELFKSKAFEKIGETKKFQSLVKRALQYANGVPLALKVLGSFLFKLSVTEWISALNRLEQTPGDEVQKVLRISYDSLNNEEKEIFLDISCFFRGKYKDEVINLLDGCGFNPVIGVEVLVRKSLLTILKNNTVWMHDLLQKMGWTIVQEQSINEPGKRSRLWHHDDIKRVLTENTGTNEIEGIYNIYPAKMTELRLRHGAFAEMTRLRILKILCVCSSVDLPNSLRYLHWHGYPLSHMPSGFQPQHLVELHLINSCIRQLWNGEMDLPKLRILNLCHSLHLTESPTFRGFPNLEELFLEGCIALQILHSSAKDLERLTVLVLKDCENLKTIPYGIGSQCLKVLIFSGCSKLSNILESFIDLKQLAELHLDGTPIKRVPHSIGNSTDLYYLDLSYCKKLKRLPSSMGQLKKLKKLVLIGCSSLSELPEEVGLIENLEVINFAFSGVRKLPSFVVCLKNLRSLSLGGCNGFPFPSWIYRFLSVFLPAWTSSRMTLVLPSSSGFNSLTSLDLGFCRLKYVPESISCFLSLKKLILTRNKFKGLPASIKNLSNLETLWLRKCKKLKELPELPSTIKYLMTSGCKSLRSICRPSLFEDARLLCFSKCSPLIDNDDIKTLMDYKFLLSQIKVNNHEEFRVYTAPGFKIPNWFTFQNVGASIKFCIPRRNLYSSNLLGFTLSAIVSTKGKNCKIGVQIRMGDQILKDCRAFLFEKNLKDVFIFYLPIQGFKLDSFHRGKIEFEVCFSATNYVDDGWTSVDDAVWKPAPEVKRCGARLIYGSELKNCDIIEEYKEATNVKSKKFKICLSLFVLFIFLILSSILVSYIQK